MAKKSRKSHSRKARSVNVLAKLAIRRASSHGGYGWIRDLPDARDYVYAAPLMRFPKGLPASVDLRSACPPIYDQGQLGSCTGNGIAGAIEFDQKKLVTGVHASASLYLLQRTRNGRHRAAGRRRGKSATASSRLPRSVRRRKRTGPTTSPSSRQKPLTKAYADAKKGFGVDLCPRQSGPGADAGLASRTAIRSCSVSRSMRASKGSKIAQTGIMTMPAMLARRWSAVTASSASRLRQLQRGCSLFAIPGNELGPKRILHDASYEYMLGRLCSDFWTIRSVAG